MKIKYVLAVTFVAMLAIPGTASQLAARSAMSAPLIGAPTSLSTAGLFSDPNVEPQLSIQLPARFIAPAIDTQMLSTFSG